MKDAILEFSKKWNDAIFVSIMFMTLIGSPWLTRYIGRLAYLITIPLIVIGLIGATSNLKHDIQKIKNKH